VPTLTDRRKAALIIGGFVLFQSCFLAIFLRFGLRHLLVHLGFLAGKHGPRRAGYLAAAIVAVAFIAISARLPSVRENLVRISWLKLLALALAVVAGSLEEIVFRGLLMDGLQNIGIGAVLQITSPESLSAWCMASGHYFAEAGARASVPSPRRVSWARRSALFTSSGAAVSHRA
jgi:hypothetical protein